MTGPKTGGRSPRTVPGSSRAAKVRNGEGSSLPCSLDYSPEVQFSETDVITRSVSHRPEETASVFTLTAPNSNNPQAECVRAIRPGPDKPGISNDAGHCKSFFLRLSLDSSTPVRRRTNRVCLCRFHSSASP